MSAMSDYLENKFLDHFLGTTSTSAPAAVYLSLHTTSPTDDGSGAELSGDGYTRQAISFGSASSSVASNDAAVEFSAATGDWGTITHIGVWDASTSGNLLFHGALTTSKTIATGDIFKAAVGGVDITAA